MDYTTWTDDGGFVYMYSINSTDKVKQSQNMLHSVHCLLEPTNVNTYTRVNYVVYLLYLLYINLLLAKGVNGFWVTSAVSTAMSQCKVCVVSPTVNFIQTWEKQYINSEYLHMYIYSMANRCL